MEQEEKPRNIGREILGRIAYVAVILLVVYVILTYVGQRTVVSGPSMDNTLAHGQSLIMDKISYRFHDPERFDIVIFPGLEEDGKQPYYIKRIIGMPGETVQIVDGKVEINGEVLKEDVYGITDYIDDPGVAANPILLSDDEYFCLGDNRPVSKDSRFAELGNIKREDLVGKVWIRIWPLDKFGKVD